MFKRFSGTSQIPTADPSKGSASITSATTSTTDSTSVNNGNSSNGATAPVKVNTSQVTISGKESNETAIAAEQINNAASNNSNNNKTKSRSQSIKPEGLHLPSIGIDAFAADDEELNEAPRLVAKDCMDPAVTAEKLNRLTELVHELSVKTRDNNAILCQMLFTMEERVNKRIDSLREEMFAVIDRKFELLAGEIQTVQAQQTAILSMPPTARGGSAAGRRHSSFGLERNNSAASTSSTGIAAAGLSAVFEALDDDAASTKSRTSLAIPKSGNSSNNNGMQTEEKKIVPIPGFVIKTRKLIGEKEKVFINVFHHELIEVVPHDLPKNISADQKPFLLFGNVTHSLDNNGRNCSTYNIGVSSEYFKPDSSVDLKITAPASIQKIIHKVNLKHNEFFDENSYSLPRLANGFKGDDLPSMVVPVLVPIKAPEIQQPPPSSSFKGSSFPTSIAGSGSGSGGGGNVSPAGKRTDRVSFSQDDNDSVVSELTLRDSEHTGAARRDSDAKKGRKMTRKSIFDTSQLAINAGNIAGRNLLSGNMCEYLKEESIPGVEAEKLKEASVTDPYVLLGWQISLIMENGETEIFVVTDVRKNYLSKTEYRLSRFYHDDLWVKLKRSDGKTGQDFRPLRKVLWGLQDDDDTVA